MNAKKLGNSSKIEDTLGLFKTNFESGIAQEPPYIPNHNGHGYLKEILKFQTGNNFAISQLAYIAFKKRKEVKTQLVVKYNRTASNECLILTGYSHFV